MAYYKISIKKKDEKEVHMMTQCKRCPQNKGLWSFLTLNSLSIIKHVFNDI